MSRAIVLVAPDVLHRHVKSISDAAAKNLHFQAPEIDAGLCLPHAEDDPLGRVRLASLLDVEAEQITTAVDIYSLGMVTLEVSSKPHFGLRSSMISVQMINLDLGGNGDLHAVTSDVVNDAIGNLDNPMQKVLSERSPSHVIHRCASEIVRISF